MRITLKLAAAALLIVILFVAADTQVDFVYTGF
jgi:hypothetical protein